MAASTSNAPKKFLFDTTFESTTAHTSKVNAKPQPKYFDADLETARTEGFSAGHAAAKQEAAQSAEQATAQAANVIAERLGALEEAITALHERQTRMAIELSAALVRKLFPKMTERHGVEEIDGLVSTALERLRDEPRIVVRVADSLLDTIQTTVNAVARRTGFEGKIVLLAEPDLAPGDARVEWADGGAERDTARAWRDIDALIHKVIDGRQKPNPTEDSQSAEPSETPGSVSVSA
jgi:flagellar assembly protein FliH